MDCEMDRDLNLYDDTDESDGPFTYGPDCSCSRCVQIREETEQDLAIDDTWVDFDDMQVWSVTEQEPDGDWRDYNAF